MSSCILTRFMRAPLHVPRILLCSTAFVVSLVYHVFEGFSFSPVPPSIVSLLLFGVGVRVSSMSYLRIIFPLSF